MTPRIPDGAYTALITPCSVEGAVDHDAVTALVGFQARSGIRGLFVLGTAGGGPLLDAAERAAVTRTILAAAGELFVIVHVGTVPTSAAIDLARDAVAAGAPAIAAVPPVYYQPDFLAVRRYYERIAAAVPGTPVLAYNNPPATGYDLRPEQAIELHAAGTISGVKQASTSVADLHALLAGDVPVWVANATLNTAGLAMGARGSISTLTNVIPEWFVALYRAVRDGSLDEARRAQDRIDAAGRILRRPIIGALHAGVTLRGLPGGSPREPLRLPDDVELEAIRGVIASLGA